MQLEYELYTIISLYHNCMSTLRQLTLDLYKYPQLVINKCFHAQQPVFTFFPYGTLLQPSEVDRTQLIPWLC